MAIPNITNRNLVKLDTNIDGHYVDIDGNYQIIENMIQVVGGADGVDAYPISGSDFSTEELLEITDVDTVISYKGSGILYDKEGKSYAHKGEMVLRDGMGNKVAIKNVSNKASTIFQSKNFNTYLKDYTLNKIIDTDIGLNLDQIITNTEIKVNPSGTGNIIQAVRNKEINSNSVSVYTVPLPIDNCVWIIGKAYVQGESVVELVDITANLVLDTSYVKTIHEDIIVPVFSSFIGTLPQVSNDVSISGCNTAIYNSFFKRYFKKIGSETTSGIHELALVVTQSRSISGDYIEPFVQATIDVLVMGSVVSEKIVNGTEVVRQMGETEIKFDTPLPNANYVVIIETENFVRKWYDSKTNIGFKIKFENTYTGMVFWTVIYTSSL